MQLRVLLASQKKKKKKILSNHAKNYQKSVLHVSHIIKNVNNSIIWNTTVEQNFYIHKYISSNNRNRCFFF